MNEGWDCRIFNSYRGQTVHVLQKEKKKQAGAELCQAQVKLGWPVSSFSLRFKIGTYTLVKDYSKKFLVNQSEDTFI